MGKKLEDYFRLCFVKEYFNIMSFFLVFFGGVLVFLDNFI